ncbi:hypothetical protein [Embleya sp. NPDC059259]|uniref:hypothetical protein n=1 Tax=unclassified Embleya TaxID=2699296 RepID=UPI00369A61B3
MPTPHGDQGMAFSAHEVRVLCRALTAALRGGRDAVDFWLLGRAIAEAQDERDRLRVFMTAELRRYRAAMPGSAAGFLSCLRNAVDEVAHIPSAEDLAALRSTVDLPCGEHERASRVALLHRCTHLAEAALEQRLTARAHRRATARSARPDPLDILIPTRPRPIAPQPPAPPEPEPAVAPGSGPECEPGPETGRVAESADPAVVTAPETDPTDRPEPGVAGESARTSEPGADSSDADVLEQDSSVEALSPVIPHRRQGRQLGQLPAPETLRTGTG